MNIFLSMLTGLALLLYGMYAMGKGLTKFSGAKMERILEKLTSNIFMAVLLGAGVTGVIQSSSATTVMVVGFVNSGMMKLKQAVGIIMGANIGTTVTSWILSLAGIQSSNTFLSLIKPSSFAPVCAIIGIILIMYSRKENRRDVGTIIIGFAILMIGMTIMSDAAKPLGDKEAFKNLFIMFNNPILGMLVGAALTAVLQSSSVSVGILQVFANTGTLTAGAAIPIIMGQNIGTCVTAIISSLGASKNAKRAALIHLYFNLIGTTIFMAIFYTVNIFFSFKFLDDNITSPMIAVIHSMFNILATLLLLPFSELLVKLATISIREDKAENDVENEDFMVLDERFLKRPAFAVEQCANVTLRMAQTAKKALFNSIDLLKEYDEEKAASVISLENQVDRYEDELGTYLVRINGKSLSEKDSRTVSTLLHVIGNFERISDHAVSIAATAKELSEKKVRFSEVACRELEVITNAVKRIENLSLSVFETEDVGMARLVEPLEEVIDDLSVEIKNRHIQRLTNDECTIELGFMFSDIINSYERVADHCSNIAVCIIQVHDDGFDTHEYLENVKHGNNEEFKTLYNGYRSEFTLS